jgi:DNA-directed RNA polymerase sigma subunit (sigma70/sigma32)
MDDGLLDELQKSEMQQQIREVRDLRMSQLLDSIPYNPRRVIELRYGLADGHQYSVEETADVFAKPTDWVVRMESSALTLIYELYHQRSGSALGYPAESSIP